MKITTDHPVLGCDLSLTSTGFVVKQGVDVIDFANPKTSIEHGTNEQRIASICASMRTMIEMIGPALAVIEAPAWSRAGRGQITQLAELAGVIKHTLLQLDILFVTITPQQNKLLATGNGKATKEQMVSTAKVKWRGVVPGDKQWNDDIADAFHLARWGQGNYSQIVEVST